MRKKGITVNADSLKRILVAGVLVIMWLPLAGLADLSSGSLTGGPGGGIFATASWDSTDTVITWEVTPTDSMFHYKYTFTVPKKGLSHIIFEVSENFTGDDYSNPDPGTVELDTYSASGPGKSNPGIPGDLYGLKFDFDDEDNEDEDLSYVIEFDSTRAPVWGDFYAKDGKDNQGTDDVYAYNMGFTDPDLDVELYHIAVPDTVTVVPVPGAVLLGMLGLAAAGRKLRKMC